MTVVRTRQAISLFAQIVEGGLGIEINGMVIKLDQRHELVLRREGNRIVIKRRVLATTPAWEKVPEV